MATFRVRVLIRLLLPRLIGKARSVELSLMGERLPAGKALECGFVNRVHDDARS
jgi:2-(1,2-epoxy-1,2-dihydrophenyl)acetyl-CoA isomerase